MAALRKESHLEPDRTFTESGGSVGAILMIAADPHLRREHRERIYTDLADNRELLLRVDDPRLVDLIYWGEHVTSLHRGYRKGNIQVPHFAKALEAALKRCEFELVPVIARMDELSKLWAGRNYKATYELLLADVIELDPARETPDELRPQS